MRPDSIRGSVDPDDPNLWSGEPPFTISQRSGSERTRVTDIWPGNRGNLPDQGSDQQVTVARTNTQRNRTLVRALNGKGWYLDEPRWFVSLKCLGVALSTLFFYTEAAIAGNLLMFFPNTITIIKDRYKIDKTIRDDTNSINLRMKNIALGILDMGSSLITRIGRAIRAAFFGIAMLGLALYGFFSPMKGRDYICTLEEKWHGNNFHEKGIARIDDKLPPYARIIRQLFFGQKAIFISTYLQPIPLSPHELNV